MPIEGRIIVGFFISAMACLFGGFGAVLVYRSYKRATKGIAARGIVVGQKAFQHSGLANTTYSPQVEFQTPSGEKIVFFASVSSGNPPRLGRQVKVLYCPDNPQDADIAAPLTSWIVPLLLLAFGLAFSWMSVVVWFVVPGTK